MLIFPGPRSETGLAVIIPLIIALALLFNPALIIAVVKHRPPQSPWCIGLISYCFANILFAICELPMILETVSAKSWPYDETWCKIRQFLLLSNNLIRSFHLPLIAVAGTFVSQYTRLSSKRKLLLPIAVCFALWIAMILFALPVTGVAHLSGSAGFKRKCLLESHPEYSAVMLTTMCIIPSIVTIILLIKWAKKLTAADDESSTSSLIFARVILIGLHIHVFTQTPYWFISSLITAGPPLLPQWTFTLLWCVACVDCFLVPAVTLMSVCPFNLILQDIWNLMKILCADREANSKAAVVRLSALPPSPEISE